MVFRVTNFVWIFAISLNNNAMIQTSDEAEIQIVSYLKEPN